MREEAALAETPVVGGAAGAVGLAEVPSERLQTEIVSLARRLSAGTYELLLLVGELDERGTWAAWGALSCAAWLAEACDVEIGTARTQVRVARAMRRFEALDGAMRSGDVSYAKARVLVPVLSDENVVPLVDLAVQTPAGRLGVRVAAWLQRHDDADAIAARQREERSVSWRTDPDGMVVITARLPPEDAGKVCAVIDTAVTRAGAPAGASLAQDPPLRPRNAAGSGVDVGADGRVVGAPAGASGAPDRVVEPRGATPPGADVGVDDGVTGGPAGAAGDRDGSTVEPAPTLRQMRADALVAVATGGGVQVEVEVVVHVRGADEACTLADGTPLSDHAVTALLPDAFVSLLAHDMARQPIDASPRRRHPTRRQRRVLDERAATCEHPGCTARAFLQYDHIHRYTDGGTTTIDNLRRLCGPHNRAREVAARPERTA